MFDSILVMSVTSAALTVALLLLRPALSKRISASSRALAWCVVLAAGLIPFRFTLPDTVPAPIPTVRETVERLVTPIDNHKDTHEIAPQSHEEAAYSSGVPAKKTEPVDARNIILLIWGAGTALFLLWGILSYLLFVKKLHSARVPAKKSDLDVLRAFSEKTILYRCSTVPTPLLIGLFRSCIYLPDIEYGDSALHSILAHELAHHRRYDVIVKWLAFIVNAVHWFNPALYLLRRELSRECDLAADEAVIRLLDKDARIGYGYMLLDMVAPEKTPAGVVSVTLCSGARTMKERIEAIMRYKDKAWLSMLLSGALLIALAILVIACSAARVQNPSIYDIPSPVLLEPETPVIIPLPSVPPSSPQIKNNPPADVPQTPETPAQILSVVIMYSNRPKTDVTCQVGECFPLSARIESAGTIVEDLQQIWASSDESVFTVDSGVITAISPGTATCSVAVGDKTAECIVRVIQESSDADSTAMSGDVLQILFSGQPHDDITCHTGESFTLEASVQTDAGRVRPAALWASSDEGVFKINSVTGQVTAVGRGTATCTLSVDLLNDSGTVVIMTSDCIIRVTGKP